MKKVFAPNIGSTGRIIRAFIAVALFVAAFLAYRISLWLSILLIANGGLAVVETLHGWCVRRAGGVKTRFGSELSRFGRFTFCDSKHFGELFLPLELLMLNPVSINRHPISYENHHQEAHRNSQRLSVPDKKRREFR